jgi:hypothetical protein
MSARFRESYRQYIQHIDVLGWECRDVLRGLGPEIRSICDFGCANGIRLSQLLAQLYPGGVPGDRTVHGIDRDGGWNDDFVSMLRGSRTAFFTSPADMRPEKYDLIHISHMLHDSHRVDDVTRFLNDCRNGAYVAVRGSLQSVAMLVDPDGSHPAEPPIQQFLHDRVVSLAATTSLSRVDRSAGDSPDALIRQRFRLGNGGAASVGAFLRSVNQEGKADAAERSLGNMVRRDPDASVPHDDVLFLYRIER